MSMVYRYKSHLMMMVVKGTTNCVMLVKPPYTRRGSLAQVSCQIVLLVTVLCCTVLYCTVLSTVYCTVPGRSCCWSWGPPPAPCGTSTCSGHMVRQPGCKVKICSISYAHGSILNHFMTIKLRLLSFSCC